MRIKTAPRRCHQVDRNGGLVFGVGCLQGLYAGSCRPCQSGIRGTEIRAGRRSSVIWKIGSRGKTSPEGFLILKWLANKLRTSQLAIYADEASASLARK